MKTTTNTMKTKSRNQQHYVIFDGTSCFVGSFEDLKSDKDNECYGEFDDIEEAENWCDSENNYVI